MLAPDREVLLILSKALDLSWATTMALLFLGAPDYRIAAKDLDAMKAEFARLDVETSKKVLEAYHSRRESAGSNLNSVLNFMRSEMPEAVARTRRCVRRLSGTILSLPQQARGRTDRPARGEATPPWDRQGYDEVAEFRARSSPTSFAKRASWLPPV